MIFHFWLIFTLSTIYYVNPHKKKGANRSKFDFSSLISGLDKTEQKIFKEELFKEVKKFKDPSSSDKAKVSHKGKPATAAVTKRKKTSKTKASILPGVCDPICAHQCVHGCDFRCCIPGYQQAKKIPRPPKTYSLPGSCSPTCSPTCFPGCSPTCCSEGPGSMFQSSSDLKYLVKNTCPGDCSIKCFPSCTHKCCLSNSENFQTQVTLPPFPQSQLLLQNPLPPILPTIPPLPLIPPPPTPPFLPMINPPPMPLYIPPQSHPPPIYNIPPYPLPMPFPNTQNLQCPANCPAACAPKCVPNCCSFANVNLKRNIKVPVINRLPVNKLNIATRAYSAPNINNPAIIDSRSNFGNHFTPNSHMTITVNKNLNNLKSTIVAPLKNQNKKCTVGCPNVCAPQCFSSCCKISSAFFPAPGTQQTTIISKKVSVPSGPEIKIPKAQILISTNCPAKCHNSCLPDCSKSCCENKKTPDVHIDDKKSKIISQLAMLKKK